MNTEEMRALPLNEKIKRAAESCCDGEAFGLMEMAVEEAIEIGTRVLMEKNARHGMKNLGVHDTVEAALVAAGLMEGEGEGE